MHLNSPAEYCCHRGEASAACCLAEQQHGDLLFCCFLWLSSSKRAQRTGMDSVF